MMTKVPVLLLTATYVSKQKHEREFVDNEKDLSIVQNAQQS
jgi:hypothetical protein